MGIQLRGSFVTTPRCLKSLYQVWTQGASRPRIRIRYEGQPPGHAGHGSNPGQLVVKICIAVHAAIETHGLFDPLPGPLSLLEPALGVFQ